jgi:hypothetical protein
MYLPTCITDNYTLIQLHSKLVPVIFSVSVFTRYQIQPVGIDYVTRMSLYNLVFRMVFLIVR